MLAALGYQVSSVVRGGLQALKQTWGTCTDAQENCIGFFLSVSLGQRMGYISICQCTSSSLSVSHRHTVTHTLHMWDRFGHMGQCCLFFVCVCVRVCMCVLMSVRELQGETLKKACSRSA